MSHFVFQPWHLLVSILAGKVNEEQQRVIEYLRTENQVLREKLGKKRILLNDDQRRRLAVKAKAIGRKALCEIATIASPDSILRWHRKLIAAKWDSWLHQFHGATIRVSDHGSQSPLRPLQIADDLDAGRPQSIQERGRIFNLEPDPRRSTNFIRRFRRVHLQHETIKFSHPMNGAAAMLLLLKTQADQLVEADCLNRGFGSDHKQIESRCRHFHAPTNCNANQQPDVGGGGRTPRNIDMSISSNSLRHEEPDNTG